MEVTREEATEVNVAILVVPVHFLVSYLISFYRFDVSYFHSGETEGN